MNNKLINILGAFVLLLCAVTSKAQQTGKTGSSKRITVNLAESRVYWTGKKPTGEHNGYVKLSGGEILLENNEIKGGSFTIDLNSIVNLDLTDASSKAKLVNHLKSADFFDVAKYPYATFRIIKVTRLPIDQSASVAPKATHNIEGELTMKGIAKRISVDASINVLEGKLTATSNPFTIDRTQWGVNYQSKSVSAELKDQFIYDDITLKIDLLTN